MKTLIKIAAVALICLIQIGDVMADSGKQAISTTISHYNEAVDISVLFLASWEGKSYKGHALGLISQVSEGGGHSVRFVEQKDGWINRSGVVSDQSDFYFVRDREEGDLCQITRADVGLTTEQVVFETSGTCRLLGTVSRRDVDYLLVSRVNATREHRRINLPTDVSLLVLSLQAGEEAQIVSDTTGVYENSTGIIVQPNMGFVKAVNLPGDGINPNPSIFLAYRIDDLQSGAIKTFSDIVSAYEYLSGSISNLASSQFISARTNPEYAELDNDEILISIDESSPAAFFQKSYTGEVRVASNIGFDLRGSAIAVPARTEQSTLISYLYFQHRGELPWKQVHSGTLNVEGIQNFIKK